MTKQEMFDRAVRGLYYQGWTRCVSDNPAETECLYSDGNGRHCAWGWVDPSVPRSMTGAVGVLRGQGVGIAAGLDDEGLRFAQALQWCHDTSFNADEMRRRLLRLAEKAGLTWPKDVPTGEADK